MLEGGKNSGTKRMRLEKSTENKTGPMSSLSVQDGLIKSEMSARARLQQEKN